MARKPYQSDMSDDQWEEIKQFIPEQKVGGRPRETDPREILNAIFYLNKSGCPWRMIPNDFPPWETVYSYFREWRLCDVWKKNQRRLEEIFKKTSRKSQSANRGYYGFAECKDYFSRRLAGIRWWQESEWPEAPHHS